MNVWQLGTLGLKQALIAFGAAAGFVTLLYLLKLRRRRVEVPFSALWTRVLEERQSAKLFRRLKRFLSWLIQVAVVALIIFALTDPQIKDWKLVKVEVPEPRHTVLVIDTSASMGTTDEGGVSRLAAAKRVALRLIRELRGDDKLVVVEMAGRVRSGTFSRVKKVLEAQVEKLRVQDSGTNVSEALAVVRQLTEGKRDPWVVWLSDGAYKGLPAVTRLRGKVQIVQFGRERANVGISELSVRPYLDDGLKFEVFLKVRNYTKRALKGKVTLYTGDDFAPGRLVAPKPGDKKRERRVEGLTIVQSVAVEIPAGGDVLRVLKDQKFLRKRLVAWLELDPGQGVRDWFPRDDFAFAVVPDRKKIRVLGVSTGNNYLYAALFLRENLEFKMIEPKAYTPEMVQKYDLVVFDRFTPKPFPSEGNFLLLEPGEGGPFELLKEKVVARPMVGKIDRKHRLMRHVEFEDVEILFAVPIKLRGKDRAPVRSASGWPLVATQSRKGRRVVAFAFDIRKSTLPLQTSFPVLLVDAINWYFEEEQRLFLAHESGTQVSAKVGFGGDECELQTPAGTKLQVPVIERYARFYAGEAGFYRLVKGKEVEVVAVNLRDREEARIGPRELKHVAVVRADKASIAQAQRKDDLWRQVWRNLLLAALMLGLVEWFTYHRRWTV